MNAFGQIVLAAATSWAAVGSPASDTPLFDGVDQAGRPVMVRARERIETLRKGTFVLNLVDGAGRPCRGQATVTPRSHEFRFGANLLALQRFRNARVRRRAYEVVDELFNQVVVANYWRQARPSPEQFADADRDLAWAREHGKTPRFHAILYSLPRDLSSLRTTQACWDAMAARVQAVADRYGAAIAEYDVINEMIHFQYWRRFKTRLRDECPHFPGLWAPANGVRAMRMAREALPNARLVALETGICTLANKRFRETVDYHRRLLALGAPVDYIGYQAHFFAGGDMPFQQGHPQAGPGAYTMARLEQGLDLLGALGKPVVITEFSPPSRNRDRKGRQPGLTDEEVAAWTANFYTLAFSKPYVRQLTRWNVIDGVAGRAMDGGLVTRQGELKPVYHALRKLLRETWATRWRGNVADGRIELRAFFGAYDIQVDGYRPGGVSLSAAGPRTLTVRLERGAP